MLDCVRTLPGLAEGNTLVDVSLAVIASLAGEKLAAIAESNGPVDEEKLIVENPRLARLGWKDTLRVVERGVKMDVRRGSQAQARPECRREQPQPPRGGGGGSRAWR